MKRIAFVLAALVFCLTFAPAGFCAEPAKPTVGIMKGQTAPDFSLKDTAGKQLSLSAAEAAKPKNNVVCLFFWATWCHYCKLEIPRYKELHEKYGAKGLKVISVDIAANDPLQRVIAFQNDMKIPFPILYDEGQKVSSQYYVYGVPVSVIIDRKGVIQYRGYQLPDNIEQLIAQLL